MRCKKAENLIQNIDQTIKDIDSISPKSPKIESYLAKFLVVYISGIYEEAIETVINESFNKFSSSQLSKFIEKHFSNTFRNPNISTLLGILVSFDNSWKDQIKTLPLKNREAFDSIYTNKNSIAHGQTCTITYAEVKQYFQDSKRVIEEIDDVFSKL